MASSDARLKRHGSVVGDTAPPTQASPTNASGDASLPLNHEHGARPASSAAGDEFRQLVTDKGRGAKAHGASRHHATPLDHHAWPSAEKCARPAKCEPLINATCFGVPLPYSHTTVELANDSSSQFEIQVSEATVFQITVGLTKAEASCRCITKVSRRAIHERTRIHARISAL